MSAIINPGSGLIENTTVENDDHGEAVERGATA